MIELIENKRAELATLCERYRVSRLELFGSATDPSRFDAATSDVDFLVAFLPLEAGPARRRLLRSARGTP